MSLAYYFAAHDPWDERDGSSVPSATADSRQKDEIPLVAAVRRGDAVAFRQIFDRYTEPLLGFAYARLGSRERAEDLVQQLFTSIWMQRTKWDVPTTVGAYLFRAIRNLIAREFRDQGVETRVLHTIAEAPPKEIAADAALTEHELRHTLARALAQMPPRPREVFLLSRERCLSYTEIASTLGVSVKTVELHMTRALAILRETFAEWRI